MRGHLSLLGCLLKFQRRPIDSLLRLGRPRAGEAREAQAPANQEAAEAEAWSKEQAEHT